MPVYNVRVREVVYHEVEINACDPDDAMGHAEEAVLLDKRGLWLGAISSTKADAEAIECELADPLLMSYEE